MTALPEQVDWCAPGPGLWMRNFRLGEWLPDALTPLFADWLLPRIGTGYLAGMRADMGTVVAFCYAAVHGWYYNALPIPAPRLLPRVLIQGRGSAVWPGVPSPPTRHWPRASTASRPSLAPAMTPRPCAPGNRSPSAEPSASSSPSPIVG